MGMIVIIEDNDCEGVVTVEVDELGCDRVVMGLTIGDCTNVEVVVVIHTELLGNLKVHAGILVVSGTEVPLSDGNVIQDMPKLPGYWLSDTGIG